MSAHAARESRGRTGSVTSCLGRTHLLGTIASVLVLTSSQTAGPLTSGQGCVHPDSRSLTTATAQRTQPNASEVAPAILSVRVVIGDVGGVLWGCNTFKTLRVIRQPLFMCVG